MEGVATFKFEPWRFQLYWPMLEFRRSEVSGKWDTCFRIVWSHPACTHYYGLGFQLLGLGAAVDYCVERPTPAERGK